MGEDRHDQDTPTKWPFDESTLRSRAEGPALGVTQAMSTSPGADNEPDRHAPPPFGPYSRIEVLVEQGSVGLVAKGYNDASARWELLEFLRAELASEIDLVRQFKREGRVLAQLSHPNVVQVFATYQVQGRTCRAMELLDGRSLAVDVAGQGGMLPVDRGLTLMLEAARGLAAVHEVGLCHRNIKPDSLFVTSTSRGKPGALKLIDFGPATSRRSTPGSPSVDPALAGDAAGGAPLYMAPELWLGYEASQASDLYALGSSFYFALAGRRPTHDSTLAAVREQVLSSKPFPDVRSLRPELPQSLAAIIDRLVDKRIEGRFATADELVVALVVAAASTRPRRVPDNGPYRGLEPFSAAERDVFCGRDREIAEVVERLRTRAAVVLVGPRGSGKSSLALAGVAPAIEDGVLGGGLVFRCTCLTPSSRPLRSFAVALASAIGIPEQELYAALLEDPGYIGKRLRTRLEPPAALLLVVDQLEELVTPGVDATAARAFARALASLVAVPTPAIRVLVTLRVDLMDRLLSIEPLRELLAAGFYPVRPLLGDALLSALIEPAHVAGYAFEDPSIADTLIEDVARTPAGLPLMSFAMASWWQARDTERRLLPSAAWKKLGGLAGALACHADSVLAGMGPDERSSARQILARMVTAGGARVGASRATLEDPAVSGSAGTRALSRLLSGKLLVENAGEVELVHEVLVSGWPTLAALVEPSSEDRVFGERVAAGAREWETQGRPDSALWDGAQAAGLLAGYARTEAPPGRQELAFVDAVRRRAARRRFTPRALVVAVVLLVLAMALALVTQVSELRIAARLEHTRAHADSAQRSYVHDRQRLLKRVALLEADSHPEKALAAVLQSRKLGLDRDLDPIAWQARLAGVPEVLPRHADGNVLVGWSSDGARIATASPAAGLRLLDVGGPGRRVLRLPSGFGPLSSLAFAPDGSRIAIGAGSGSIAVIKASGGVADRFRCQGPVVMSRWKEDGTLLAACGRAGSLDLVAFSDTDGRRVLGHNLRAYSLDAGGTHAALVAAGGEMSVLDTDDGSRRSVKLPDADVTAVALSPDAFTLLAGDARGRIARVSLQDSRSRPSWRSTSSTASWQLLEASPDGRRWLGIDAGRHAVLWNSDLDPVTRLDVSGPLHTWIPSRRSLVVTGPDDTLRVVAEDTGTPVGRLAGAVQPIGDLAADKDGHWLVASSLDGAVRAWPLDEASVRVLVGPAPPGMRCDVASDGSAIACLDAQVLRIEPTGADRRGGGIQVELPPAARPPVKGRLPFAVGPRATTAAWLLPGGTLVRIQAGRPIVRAAPAGEVLLVYGHSGSSLALAGEERGRHELWIAQAATKPLRKVQTLPAAVTAFAFSADDARLVVGDAEGTVRRVDVASATIAAPLHVLHGQPITALALSQDGTQLAAAGRSGQVRVQPLSGGSSRRVYRADSEVRCLAWSVGGRGLVVGTADGHVELVDTGGVRVLPLLAAPSAVRSCVRNPGDDRFTFVTRDGMVWQRRLDLSTIGMLDKPSDALDPHADALDQWKGLGRGARSP